MGSKMFSVDTFELHKAQNHLDLINDTIKVVLCSTFSPIYSAWAAETSYSLGDIVVPSVRNGRRYRATNSGTSGSSGPTWPTSDGATVEDNNITWEEYGGEHANNEIFSDVAANEVADGDGYTVGGQTLSDLALTQLADDPAVVKWDATDITWTNLSKTMRTAWIMKASPRKSLNDGSSDYWTVSGSGTNEYYYTVGDVSSEPLEVYANGTLMTKGTPGSLSANEWGFGDLDGVGSDTVYVRLSDDSDPDSKSAGYVECVEASEEVADPIVAYILLDDTPTDVTTTDANFKLQFNAAGIMHFGRNASI